MISTSWFMPMKMLRTRLRYSKSNSNYVQKGVDKIAQKEHKVEQDTGGTQLETEKVKKELSEMNQTPDFEMLFQYNDQHMLDRMKKDLISLQLYSNNLMEKFEIKKDYND